MVTEGVGIFDNGLIKSISDKKSYKVVVLENGLKALLISEKIENEGSDNESEEGSEESDYSEDEEISSGEEDCEQEGSHKGNSKEKSKKLAAAALCISVGSFSDPNKVPGLAHFLEHMVFMGSSKYPDENKFDAFIRLHGGSDNASTDTESTVFQFDIQPEHFSEALDIWAQFFISPLLKQDSIDREMKAVDSEFALVLNSDACKKEQVFTSLLKHDHVMGKFMWGNLHSLTNIPKENNINLYSELEAFFKCYYTADRMTLAVQSPDTLENLEKIVRTTFECIPASKTNFSNGSSNETNFEECKFENHVPFTITKLQPIKNTHELHLTWILPPQQVHYKIKPIHYVAWLIGHEGKGSILSYLRKQHWATSLAGGNTETGLEHNSTCSLFNITVTLTEAGFKNYEKVLDVIFSYMEHIRRMGPQERVFNEIQRIENINFMYQTETSSLDNVEDQCGNMRLYPTEDILTGDELLMEYNPDIINSVIQRITPETAVIFFSSPFHKDLMSSSEAKIEPWFNTKYVTDKAEENWTNKWKNYRNMTLNNQLDIPPPNKLIAQNFQMKALTESDAVEKVYPKIISASEDKIKLWFKPDNQFQLPKGYINILLGNPTMNMSPLNRLCFDIYLDILSLNMAEVIYDADAALLHYRIKISTSGCLELIFDGFNDKLSELVFMVARYIANFETTEEIFTLYLEQRRKNITNFLIKPSKLCNNLRLSLLEAKGWLMFEKLRTTHDLTFQQFSSFASNISQSMVGEMLIQGNYTLDEAKGVAKSLEEILNLSDYRAEYLFNEQVVNLPSTHYCKIKGCNATDENSSLTIYYQVGPHNLKQSAMMELLITIMEEPCFDILRTKQQLGYSVYARQHDTAGILGFSVNVQPQRSKHSVEKVDLAIVNFVNDDMLNVLEKLDETAFKTQVESLISAKENDDDHLGEEVGRNWGEITSQKYNFDHLEKEVIHLKTFTLTSLREFYHEVARNNSKILHVQVEGSDTTQSNTKTVENTFKIEYLTGTDVDSGGEKATNYIMDISKFKQHASFYSVCHEIEDKTN